MPPDPRFVEGEDPSAVASPQANADVFAFLRAHQPSCHSDTGALLIASAGGCGDWIAFSPSFPQCRYVALVTGGVVFALGFGQRGVAYRLPAELREVAEGSGATPAPQIGQAWVQFELFRPSWPMPDLAFWTLRAYAAARGQGE